MPATNERDLQANKDPEALKLISQATQHESEAEKRLLAAIEEERRKKNLQNKKGEHVDIPSVPSTALPQKPSLQRQKGLVRSTRTKPDLTTRTQYLVALHEGMNDDDDDSDDEEADDHPDLARANSADRVYQAAAVLQEASKQKSKPNRKTSSLDNDNETNDQHKSSEQLAHDEGASHNNIAAVPSDVEAVAEEKPHGHTHSSTYLGSLFAIPKHARKGVSTALEAGAQEVHSFHDFFTPKKPGFRRVLLFSGAGILLPCLLTAILLFYALDNPPTGRCEDGLNPCGYSKGKPVPSASWWVLFLGVRQIVTFLLAKAFDIVVIDWLILQHATVVRILGPNVSLIAVQSKGWPSVLFWFSVWNAILLYGPGSFPQHWLYFQDALKIFNKENPSGEVTTAEAFLDLIISGLIVSGSVSLKRYFVGLHLGHRLHSRFSGRLQETIQQITIVSELSLWARRKRDRGAKYSMFVRRYCQNDASLEDPLPSTEPDLSPNTADPTADANLVEQVRESLRNDEVIDYDKILDPWEEPNRSGNEDVSGSRIAEFRHALTAISTQYLFSSAFGPVESRAECIHAADRLFRRLLILMEEEETFDLNNLARWMFRGQQNREEASAELVELLCPDHEGRLDALDFVRAVDAVYKQVRFLESAISNASHIERGYERVINIFFYCVLGFIVLAILSLDTLAFVVGLSGVLISFSFMIGSAFAQLFEGVLLILGRQPYDVGDRVAIANADDPPDRDGSRQWMVERIDLVTTTARLTGTGEVTSFSNGALARCRIINMNRSSTPILYVISRFPCNVPFSKILVFKSTVEKYIQEKPQEWQKMLGFRASRIEPQENFVEYEIVLQHKLSWQSLIPILESRSAVATFCVEVQKQLGCRYVAPSMPVEIGMTGVQNAIAVSNRSNTAAATANAEQNMDQGKEKVQE